MHPMEQNDFQHIATMLRPRLISLCQQFFDCQELAFDAEDAVQETLLRLWQLRDRMKDYQKPEALATIIAKNVCINILKRGGTQHDVLDERLCIEASSKTDQTVIVQDAERRIGQALARLPKTQRRLLKMRSDGMSIFEIATACNLTTASTKTLICAARKTMMELLKTGRKKK